MTKKHILKPGLHQFAPGSPATHHNDNLTDAEAEWYLKRFPHIRRLFEIHAEEEIQENKPVLVTSKNESAKPIQKPVQSKKKSK